MCTFTVFANTLGHENKSQQISNDWHDTNDKDLSLQYNDPK